MENQPFWQHKKLSQMNDKEWEALCDGCGKCCLHKFIEDDTVEVQVSADHIEQGEQLHHSKIACRYLNLKTCGCTQYNKRAKLVPDCVTLDKNNLAAAYFMPPSCAYRRLAEGKGLPSWHPLLHKGKKTAMHKAGMSVRGKVVSEDTVNLDDFENYIVSWPLNEVD